MRGETMIALSYGIALFVLVAGFYKTLGRLRSATGQSEPPQYQAHYAPSMRRNLLVAGLSLGAILAILLAAVLPLDFQRLDVIVYEVLDAPTTAKVHETFTVVLTLTEEDLYRVRDPRVADASPERLEAHLFAGQADVGGGLPLQEAVGANPAKWTWTVTPSQGGEMELLVTLHGIEGSAAPYSFGSIERVVDVKAQSRLNKFLEGAVFKFALPILISASISTTMLFVGPYVNRLLKPKHQSID
jgi:hypothetical protein